MPVPRLCVNRSEPLASYGHDAAILKSVLNNEASPFLEVSVLNAGLGFFAAGVSETIAAGIAKAREVIASGQALAKLVEMQELK